MFSFETLGVFLSNPAAFISLIASIVLAGGAVVSAFSQEKAQRDLFLANNEIKKLNKIIIDSITGGDAYAYVQLMSVGADIFIPVVIHCGDCPLYDVHVDMANVKNVPEHSVGLDELMSTRTRALVGNMTKGYCSILRETTILLDRNSGDDFNVFFNGRNGGWRQELLARHVNGSWRFALMVKRENIEIFRKIDEHFPLPIPF